MKLFIAGCARSGTTLIQDLMNCFADTEVWPAVEWEQFKTIARSMAR